jgi:hypothetical protein
MWTWTLSSIFEKLTEVICGCRIFLASSEIRSSSDGYRFLTYLSSCWFENESATTTIYVGLDILLSINCQAVISAERPTVVVR